MTTVIDERVVEMRFNNAEFEKNVAQSMKTIDELKKSLNFEGAAKSLNDLSKASNGFRLTGITDTIQEAANKFSVMEIAGMTAIAKITSSAMDMGVQLVKSLSVDQVTTGFNKYAEKTTAIQTIMAATESMFSSQAEQMKVVESEMSKLAWFTDETSYNFIDMVSNIGKFTSNKIGLEESVTAMQGIANWAARSGQNAQAASRAMYNISQAMGAGAMKQKDWMSIENANMATAEFKQTAIETAEELGRLKKVSDGLWTTLDGKGTVTVETFREELKRGWFDKDVMSETFRKYGQYTNVLYELAEMTDLSASEIMQASEKFKKGELDITSFAAETGASVDELTDAFNRLNEEGNDLGRKAFGNAQEAKTFLEAIDATKDAVSTKWTETFELIFGNYLEAKKLWTGLANDLWQAFAAGGDERNSILSAWRDLDLNEIDGRTALIEGLINAVNLLVKPLSTVKQAFRDMFGSAEEMGVKLNRLTVSFRDFMASLQPSNEMLANIYRTFKGLFTIGKLVSQVIFSIVKAILPAARPFGSLLELILQFTGYAGVFIEVIAEYAEEVGLFQTITEGVVFIFNKLLQAIKTVATIIGGGLFFVASTVVSVFGKIIGAISKFLSKTQIIQKAIAGITKVVDKFRSVFARAEKPIEKVNTVVVEAEKCFSAASISGAEFGTVINDTGEKSQKALTPLQRVANVIKLVVTALGVAVVTVIKLIGKLWENIKAFFSNLSKRFNDANEDKNAFVIVFEELFNRIKEILGDAKDKIKEFFDNLGIDTSGLKKAFDTINTALGTFIENVGAGRIVAIVLSIALLALVGEAIDLAQKISTLSGTMNTFVKNINKILTKQFGGKVTMLTDLAKAFALIAGSLALLMAVDPKGDKIVRFAVTMGVLVGALALIAAGIEFFSKKALLTDMSAAAKTLLALAGALAIVTVAMGILANAIPKDADLKVLNEKMRLAFLGLMSIAGIAIIMSHLIGPATAGAAVILALGFALMQVAKAMKEIATIPVEDLNLKWKEYATMFGGLSALVASTALINVRNALGLILVAKALEMLIPQLNSLAEFASSGPGKAVIQAAMDKIEAYIPLISVVIALIGALVTLTEVRKLIKGATKGFSFSDIFSGLGGVLAGLGVGIFLIVSSIEKIKTIMDGMSKGEIFEIGVMLGIVMLAMAAFSAIIIAVDRFTHIRFPLHAESSFLKMGAMFVALGLAVNLMTAALESIANSPANGFELAGALVIVVGLGLLLAAIVGIAGTVPKAIPAMAALVATCVAMGVLIGEFAVLTLLVDSYSSDWAPLATAFAMMVGLLAMLGLVVLAVSKLSGLKVGAIWAVVAMIVAIGALFTSIALLTTYNLDGTLMALRSVMAILWMLGEMFRALNATTLPNGNIIGAMIAVTVALGVLGLSLWAISKNNWVSIGMAGAAMVFSIIAIAGALKILGGLSSGPELMGAAVAADLLSLAMIAIAHSLEIMKDMDAGDIAKKVLATIGIITVLMGIMAGISTDTGEMFAIGMAAFAGSLVFAAAAFAIFASAVMPLAEGIDALTPALTKFAKVPFLDISAGLSNLSGGLFTLGLGGVVLGFGAPGLISGSIGIWALGEAIGSAVGSFEQLSTVDLTSLAWGLGEIGVAGAVIGFMAPAILVGAAALALFGGALYILKGGLEAILGMFTVFGMEIQNGTASIKTSLDDSKKDFSDFLVALAGTFGGPLAASVVKAATAFGKLIGGKKGSGEGVVGGLSEATDYASPPGFILKFFSACATAFGMNGEAVSAASQSGAEMGNGLGESFFDTAMGWISSVGSAISGWWSNMTSHFNITDNPKVINDLGSAGAAAEKFGKQSEKSGNIFTNAWNAVTDTVGGLADKTKQKFEETKETIGDALDINNYVNFDEEVDKISKSVEEATGGLNGFGDAASGAGSKAKGAAGDVKELGDSLKDTISNQLDMFSKFEIKTGVTAETMLENMRSNINGFASWSHRMSVLAERFATAGIDQGLYKKLAELGPKGYETMNAFYEMSEEQLAEVKDLWATGLTLPESQADIVNSGFQYMGEMAAQGFSNALDDHKAAHAAAHGLGQAALDGLSEALEVHSPSKATEQIGQYLIEGLAKGLDSVYGQGILYFAVKHVSEHVLNLFNENLSPEVMGEAGSGILTNLFTGLLGESIEANPIFTAFLETFTNFEPIDEALLLFVEHLKELLYEQFEIEGDGEPSEWFYRYAMSWLQAIINSFIENEVLVRVQLIIFCMHIIETMDEQDLPGYFNELGISMVDGLAEGLADEAAVSRAVDAAIALAGAVNEAVAETLEVNSPSKVMIRMGHSVGEGLVIGISDGASNVYNAAKTVAEGGIDGMQGEMGRLQDLISTGLDFNPIITPMLDLSYIKQQMSELDYLMNDPEYGIGQNGGEAPAGKTQQINFTQNNYSPKSLSRYEIYRQTQNQISQLKGALG